MKSKKITIIVIIFLSIFITSCEVYNYAVIDIDGTIIIEYNGQQTNQITEGTSEVLIKLNSQGSTPLAIYRPIYIDGNPTNSYVENDYEDMTSSYTLLYNNVIGTASVSGYLDVSDLTPGTYSNRSCRI